MDAVPVIMMIIVLVFIGVLAMILQVIQNRLPVLGKIDAKIDLLMKHAGIEFDPYANVPPEVVEAVRQGEKIKAIKLYRRATGAGLKESKDFVEQVQRRAGVG
jgi:ribosomal protein L7/L12